MNNLTIIDLSCLKCAFWFQMSCIARITNISLNPTYIFTSSETPFLKTLLDIREAEIER